MNRRELETLLLTLESTPPLMARAARGLPASDARRRPAAGGFSLTENVWHLADLEREGFGVRIRRILCEDEPTLSNFDGDRGVGPLSLADLPRKMAEHDRSHTSDVAALLAELSSTSAPRGTAPPTPHRVSAVA
ncbi:MAG: DinB family protein [Acidobacteria bacterium]|nr:DinB family protein [Acidobacteriota bacterium]